MSEPERLEIVFDTGIAANTRRDTRGIADDIQRAGRAAQYAQGPYQRLAKLRQQMVRAAGEGNVSAQRDIAIAAARARRQIASSLPKAPKSLAARANDVIRTARVGAGGIEPLVGRIEDLIGPEATAIAGVTFAAVEAAKALYEVADGAAASGRAFAQTGFTAGTVGTQTALLGGTARALGMDPGALASRAAAYNQRITSDPTAMAYASRMGISNAPGVFGGQNYGGEFLRAIEGLRRIKDPTEQLRSARAQGLEDVLQYTLLSERTLNRLRADSIVQARVYNRQFQEDSVEFQAAQGRLSSSFDTLGAAVSGPLVKDFTDLGNAAASAVNALTREAVRHPRAASTLNEYAAFGPLFGGLFGMVDAIRGMRHKGGKSELGQNTDAIKGLTGQLGVMGRQYGHGGRADAAIPGAFGMGSGYAVRQNLKAGGFRLGYNG